MYKCRKDSRRRPGIGYYVWNVEKLSNADYLAHPRTVKDEEYMKIERLSKLLNSFGSTTPSTDAQRTSESNRAADEAVRISSGFGKASSTEEGSETRARRVAELAEQVRAGTYKPDSSQVASAVARELFA